MLVCFRHKHSDSSLKMGVSCSSINQSSFDSFTKIKYNLSCFKFVPSINKNKNKDDGYYTMNLPLSDTQNVPFRINKTLSWLEFDPRHGLAYSAPFGFEILHGDTLFEINNYQYKILKSSDDLEVEISFTNTKSDRDRFKKGCSGTSLLLRDMSEPTTLKSYQYPASCKFPILVSGDNTWMTIGLRNHLFEDNILLGIDISNNRQFKIKHHTIDVITNDTKYDLMVIVDGQLSYSSYSEKKNQSKIKLF